MVDSKVALTGIATDYKAGAAIVLDDGGSVLLDGLDYWGSALRGKRVMVSGTLRHAPASTSVGPDTVQVQHVVGDHWWIEEPKIEGASR